LRIFWEDHHPTQGMRQGNDNGTQDRSKIYVTDPSPAADAEKSLRLSGDKLAHAGHRGIARQSHADQQRYYAQANHTREQSRVKLPTPRSHSVFTATSSPRPATGRSRPRSSPTSRSTTPRTTTSSTWPRTRMATAGSAEPASAAQSG